MADGDDGRAAQKCHRRGAEEIHQHRKNIAIGQRAQRTDHAIAQPATEVDQPEPGALPGIDGFRHGQQSLRHARYAWKPSAYRLTAASGPFAEKRNCTAGTVASLPADSSEESGLECGSTRWRTMH